MPTVPGQPWNRAGPAAADPGRAALLSIPLAGYTHQSSKQTSPSPHGDTPSQQCWEEGQQGGTSVFWEPPSPKELPLPCRNGTRIKIRFSVALGIILPSWGIGTQHLQRARQKVGQGRGSTPRPPAAPAVPSHPKPGFWGHPSISRAAQESRVRHTFRHHLLHFLRTAAVVTPISQLIIFQSTNWLIS